MPSRSPILSRGTNKLVGRIGGRLLGRRVERETHLTEAGKQIKLLDRRQTRAVGVSATVYLGNFCDKGVLYVHSQTSEPPENTSLGLSGSHPYAYAFRDIYPVEV